MSVHPQVATAATGNKGVHEKLANLRRRVSALESNKGGITADAITGANIAPETITATEIEAGTITGDLIAAGAIYADLIGAQTIQADHILANTITANEIAAKTITADQIAAGSITADVIAAGAITAGAILAGSITTASLQVGSVTAEIIQADSIRTEHLSAGSITAETIAAGAITTGHLAAGSITASTIQAGTITADQIAAGSITADVIAASAIQTNHLAAGSVTAQIIQANAITAEHVQADSITATHIATDSITANEIRAGEVNATHITASTLQTLWTQSALITGSEIRGARFVTSLTDANMRVDIQPSGMKGYNASGELTFDIGSASGVIIQADPGSTVPSTTLSGYIGGGNLLPDSSFESPDPTLNVTNTRVGFITSRNNASFEKATVGVHAGAVSFDGSSSLLVKNGLTGTGGGATNPYVACELSTLPQFANFNSLKGKPVVLSAWVYITGTDNTSPANLGMLGFWNPLTGTLQSDNNTVGSIPKNTWVRLTLKVTIPAASTSALIFFRNPWTSGLNNVYYDAIQFEIADKESAYSPKADEIIYGSIKSVMIGASEVKAGNIEAGSISTSHLTVAFGGPNRLINPGFENNSVAANTNVSIPGWDGLSNATTQRSTAQFRSGTSSMRLAAVAAGTSYTSNFNFRPTVVGNQKYTFSGYAQNASGGKQLLARIMWYDATVTNVGTDAQHQIVPGGVGAWTRFIATGTAPPTAVSARCLLYVISPAAGDAIFVDEVQFELGGDASPWSPNPNEILPNTIGPTQITPNSITSSEINAVSIRGAVLTADSISGTMIQGNAITASKLLNVGFGGANHFVDGSFEGKIPGANALVVNPSDWTGWSAQNTTTSVFVSGGKIPGNGKYIQVINTLNASGNSYLYYSFTGSKLASIAGRTVTVSMWVWLPSGNTYAAGNNVMGITTNTTSAFITHEQVTKGGWQQIKLTHAIPASSTYFNVTLYAPYVTATQANYFDAIQVEIGDLATSYTAFGPDQIVGTQITPGTITTSHIATNTITADKLNFRMGGRNLYANSSFENNVRPGTWYDWNGNVVTKTIVDTTVVGETRKAKTGEFLVELSNVGGTGTAYSGLYNTNIEFVNGRKYTFSIWAKGVSGSAGRMDFYVGSNGYFTATHRDGVEIVDGGLIWADSLWHRYSATVTYTGATGKPEFHPFTVSMPIGCVVHVDDCQIEEGDVLTNWTPYIDPTVIDGSTIQGATIRTGPTTGDRVQMTTSGGIEVYSGGVRTAQMKGGAGGLDLTSISTGTFASALQTATSPERKLRFLHTDGTTVIGDLSSAFGTYTGTFPGVMRNVNLLARETSSGAALLNIGTTDGGGGTLKASISLRSDVATPGNGEITASINGKSVLLLRGDGVSDVAGGYAYINRSGGLASSAPPNGVSGDTFYISRPGTYMFIAQHTGFNNTGGYGQCTIFHYIDGSSIGNQTLYIPPGSHYTFPMVVWARFLAAGTHYWWAAQFFNTGTDSNDFGSLAVIKVGA